MASLQGYMLMIAYERLTKAVGAERALHVARETQTALAGRALDGPQDLLDIANHLAKQGGVVAAVGRALRVQAFLRGAVEP